MRRLVLMWSKKLNLSVPAVLTRPRCHASWIMLLLFCAAGLPGEQLFAQTPGVPGTQGAQDAVDKLSQATKEKDNTKGAEAAPEEMKPAWVFAPLPLSSPAIGSGLVMVGARVFPINKHDRVTPPSVVGAAGVLTNNGTRALGFGGRLYLKEDKYRLTAFGGHATVNADIYGLDHDAGDDGVFIPLNVRGNAVLGEFFTRIRKNTYIGVRGQYRNLRLSINQDKLDSEDDYTTQPPGQVSDLIDQITSQLLQQQTVSLGPRFQYDSRDSTFYPRRGIFTEASADLFGEAIGSKWSYQYYKVFFNLYREVAAHSVLAFRGMGCAAAGETVPIYDLCLFGTQNDLRGYPGGKYQDRRMFATQAEYRFTIPAKSFLGRFGIVAFGGVGGVDKSYSAMSFDRLLPAGGGGLRFRLTKKYPINFRADYAFAKGGHTLSIGVLEAF